MKIVYEYNGLPFSDGSYLIIRNFIKQYLTYEIKSTLKSINRGWDFKEIEAPCFIPSELVSEEYSSNDIYIINDRLTLKPETTASSYYYLNKNMESPPICIYQSSKSFRNEQDKTFSNMRFKEFYQLEFQCIFAEGTKADYYEPLINSLSNSLSSLRLDVRKIESDRLPKYSKKTWDVEVWSQDANRYVEVASISYRDDVPFEFNSKKLFNVEVAIGLDRISNLMRIKNDKI